MSEKDNSTEAVLFFFEAVLFEIKRVVIIIHFQLLATIGIPAVTDLRALK
ncbi:MAG: hypothetical protein ACJASQ_002360 [Crocinitomicaceae bacterium]|jgi:hypothetical protein